ERVSFPCIDLAEFRNVLLDVFLESAGQLLGGFLLCGLQFAPMLFLQFLVGADLHLLRRLNRNLLVDDRLRHWGRAPARWNKADARFQAGGADGNWSLTIRSLVLPVPQELGSLGGDGGDVGFRQHLALSAESLK